MSMSIDKHVTILSILYIGCNAFLLLAALIAGFVLIGGGLLSGEGEAIAATWIVAMVLGAILVVVSVPGIIGGVGLVKRRGWARILVLVLGFLNLLSFPLGTCLGIYTIWTLMQDEAETYFATA